MADARKQILDAAQRLFADAGFAATSTAKIAASAGVPHGLVCYYFPTKRDLLLAVVKERAYQDSPLTGGAQGGPRDVGEVLTAAARELVEVFSRNRDTQVILFREVGTDPEMHALVTTLVASSTGDVAELLGRAADAPPEAEVRLAARLLTNASVSLPSASTLGTAEWAISVPSPRSADIWPAAFRR